MAYGRDHTHKSFCKFQDVQILKQNSFLHHFHLHNKYQGYNIYKLAVGAWRVKNYKIQRF